MVVDGSSGLKAVVVGATGATGKELVSQLLSNPRWSRVVAIGRRRPEIASTPQQDPQKLEAVIVNMDALEEEAKAAFEGADSVFCALGTTRAVAGSAENFRKVDLDYVAASARAAKAAGVPHFSLVSAQGASSSLPANDWKVFHGLLYSKTKGQAEDAVKAQNFPYTTIMRPGLLDRGAAARPLEQWLPKIVSSVPVSKVASVMVAEAERYHSSPAEVHGVNVMSMKDIQKYSPTIVQ